MDCNKTDILTQMGIKREIYQLVVVGLSIWVVLSVTIQNYRVSGISMDPYLSAGDYLIVDKFNYLYLEGDILDRIIPFKGIFDDTQYSFEMNAPKRGDIVVFQYPLDDKQYFVKRVIGMPNETVTIEDGSIYINGYELIEPYLLDVNYSFEHQYYIGEDEYFVLGDNRNNSNDSRHWGAVHRNQILGEVLYKYWPLN